MRRAITALVALLAMAGAALAAEQQPRTIVMAYECKQIDPKVTGFSCQWGDLGMHLQWHENPDEMIPARRERALYEFNKIALRYVEMGGKRFEVGFDSWKKGDIRNCYPRPSKVEYDYYCTDR